MLIKLNVNFVPVFIIFLYPLMVSDHLRSISKKETKKRKAGIKFLDVCNGSNTIDYISRNHNYLDTWHVILNLFGNPFQLYAHLTVKYEQLKGKNIKCLWIILCKANEYGPFNVFIMNALINSFLHFYCHHRNHQSVNRSINYIKSLPISY